MPELADRDSYERRLLNAMRSVFEAAYKVISQGLDAVNKAIQKALKKYAGPIFDEVQRRAAIFLLLFFQDDDEVSAKVEESGKTWKQIKKDATDRAKKSSKDQLDRLGKQIAETNSNWWDEWDEEFDPPFEEWAKDRMFPDSRSETISITEITSSVGEGEYTVRDALEEAGVSITAVWHTARDDRVCPICAPYHLRPEVYWIDEFPYGPPVHPRCRCYLDWYED